MILTLDVENTTTKRDGKLHLDPFEPTNTLVMVGMLDDQGVECLVTFDHNDVPADIDGHTVVQEWLDRATVLVMHNAAHDLLWLWESGFKYNGPVFDTMLAEYVLQRGVKEPLSLEACADRYALDTRKQDTLKEYFSKGYNTREIPWDVLVSYLSSDLGATQQLADRLMLRLNSKEDSGLLSTVDLTNQVATCLARIYQRGFAVDLSVLDTVRQQFEQERDDLERDLQQHVRTLMGDTPINLNSPEQLSWVIYSRKVIDKPAWGNAIEPYMSGAEFDRMISAGTERLYKTKAVQCHDCNGTGHIRKVRKDGTPYSKPNRCRACNGNGYLLTDLGSVAGLRFKPPSAKWASANGFSTSKQNLETLEKSARVKGMTDAEEFLSKVRRLSAVDTYLSSFVDGIRIYTKQDGKLHVRLLQHRASTGRLSSADPNMQNMPRGGTFPVKKVFVSRFNGGKIMEADFAQLEFRAAAYLSQDGVAIDEVSTGFDVHSYTAQVITDAGQKTSRQDAKAHTFAPLFGATGYGRSKAEAAYYKLFVYKYKGIAAWHKKLGDEALRFNKITNVSGRQYAFPTVRRRDNGMPSHFTMIKNYPVQGFATGDIVPIVLNELHELLQPYNSVVVNSVHDSMVVDIHPDEEQQVIDIIESLNDNINALVKKTYNVEMNVPLLLEAKIGSNWLDTVDV